MLIRDVYIVDNHVRVYDMDGSHVDFNADDAIDLLGWLLQKKEHLLDIMRDEQKRMQRREDQIL
jgi:hypothetical protein